MSDLTLGREVASAFARSNADRSKRWVVERTCGWLAWCRRSNGDREGLPATLETWIYMATLAIWSVV